MDPDIQRFILEALRANIPATVVTAVEVRGSAPCELGRRMIVYPDRTFRGTIGGGRMEQQALELATGSRGAPFRETVCLDQEDAECGGTVTLLFEPVGRRDELVILGGGHCGAELSRLTPRLGFRVTVIDDRPEWADPARHPAADEVVCVPYSEAAGRIPFSEYCHIVIMTHGHENDEALLRACLRREFRYLGMIGSRRKVDACFERLRRDGHTPQELARVSAPIGLDIGSRTPAEIAVSIAAQLVAVRRGRGGQDS